MKVLTLVFMVILVGINSAKAEWVYGNQESSFEDKRLDIVFNKASKNTILIACENNKKVSIAFMTSVTSHRGRYNNINATYPKLKIRVDNNPIEEFDTELFDSKDGAAVTITPSPDLIKSISKAENKIAVRIESLGFVLAEENYDTSNINKSFEDFFNKCELN
ncbi:hypothetical protein [Pseudochrobactrum asaccharolyticum]|uniref:hypothetical protein n=1 Tax=Pseudochrobactrum asaccharolyticum TaxID=354351 RepID=UPI0040437ED2